MAHYEREGVSFDLPDKVTVRQQLAYFSATTQRITGDWIFGYWKGAQVLIENWKSDKVSTLQLDLETVTDPEITQILIWAALTVKSHLDNLSEVPKN